VSDDMQSQAGNRQNAGMRDDAKAPIRARARDRAHRFLALALV
jgi:hypothetical protein